MYCISLGLVGGVA